ncbi:MAG TPA: zinc permease [Microbacteriaceae bacterium]|jgi:ZIP family zinc transporter|nr:zinc permease [Microbacteriaceae bacterium]
MSLVNFLILGAIAGFTIFLGLPIGRLRSKSLRLMSLLNAITIGVLIFLLWDVFSHALEPIDSALADATAGKSAAWLPSVGLVLVFFAAVAVGLVSLVAYDRWVARRADASTMAAVSGSAPGILRLGEAPSRLAFLIAVGIGLHNFSEGLAIGQSAANGQISLAVVLVVGFGLHNATEGFGITAPLAGHTMRPSWGQLAVLGVIGGAPTVVGTLLGSVFVNDVVSMVFLALASGSILYVIVQLLGVSQRFGRGYTLYVGMLIGLFAGFATDFVVTAAGV